MSQPLRNSTYQHVSTTGCLVEDDRWELRKVQAVEMVERRLLTVLEASEHFGLPANEIDGSLQVTKATPSAQH